MASAVTAARNSFRWQQDKQTVHSNAFYVIYIVSDSGVYKGIMMRSKSKLLESLALENLVDEFLDELSDYDFGTVKIAELPKSKESNLIPAINDAFFGPPTHGTGPDAFVARINKPDSNFNKAAGMLKGKITVKITVDAAKQTATFLTVGPGVGTHADLLQKALEADYVAMYGKTPAAQLAERLASNQINPPDIHGTATVMTV